MIERIHLDPKLEKCLEVLKKGSRRACLAADRAAGIIEELKRGEIPPGDFCAFTRHGEARIKGCRKYNLGAGYRLITLKQGDDLYLLFWEPMMNATAGSRTIGNTCPWKKLPSAATRSKDRSGKKLGR